LVLEKDYRGAGPASEVLPYFESGNSKGAQDHTTSRALPCTGAGRCSTHRYIRLLVKRHREGCRSKKGVGEVCREGIPSRKKRVTARKRLDRRGKKQTEPPLPTRGQHKAHLAREKRLEKDLGEDPNYSKRYYRKRGRERGMTVLGSVK